MRFLGAGVLFAALLTVAGALALGLRWHGAAGPVARRAAVPAGLVGALERAAQGQGSEEVARAVQELAALPDRPRDYAGLLASAPKTARPRRLKRRPRRAEKRKKTGMKYRVRMAFVAPGHRYAVVNDRFVREGDVLPGGGRVTAILPGEVLIVRDGRRYSARVPGAW